MPLRKLTELFLVQVAEGSHFSRPHGSLHCPPLYAKVKQAIVQLSLGIPLIVIPGKILARIFFNRWPLPRKRVWLLKGLMPFAARQLQEECKEQN